MGGCTSCESAAHVSTAKLILQDGRLQEYSYPVKASYVLAKNPTFFICNSDEMDFDDVVSAVNGDEELQPGQLYFVLPIGFLKRPLQPDEMAALAVKASSALMKSSTCSDKCSCRRKTAPPTAFSGEKSRRRVAAEDVNGGSGRGSRSGRNDVGRKFTPLRAIAE